MSGERAVVDALLACLPLSDDGTGHVVDCGYDHDVPTCGCYTLPERFEHILAASVASAAAERERLGAVAARLDRWEEQIGEWYDDPETGSTPEGREGYDRGVTHLIAALRAALSVPTEAEGTSGTGVCIHCHKVRKIHAPDGLCVDPGQTGKTFTPTEAEGTS